MNELTAVVCCRLVTSMPCPRAPSCSSRCWWWRAMTGTTRWVQRLGGLQCG